MEIGREICSHFDNTDNNLTREEDAPFTNFEIPEETNNVKVAKPASIIDFAAAPNKNNEQDYDDIDRFMKENNFG